MPEHDQKPTCFIAMPITTHEHEVDRYGDDDHWMHVMKTVFEPAVTAAGFEPILPIAKGSHMIHGQIIKHLSTADMVLCDLSGHNPNVFFELGVRTSLDLPIALVRDEHTTIPFDTSGINTHTYKSTLNGWDIAEQIDAMTHHVSDCVASSAGHNPLWKHFGLTIVAGRPDVSESAADAKLELIYEGMADLRRQIRNANTIAARAIDGDELERRDTEVGFEVGKMIGVRGHQISRNAGSGRLEFIWEKPEDGWPPAVKSKATKLLDARGFDAELITLTDDQLRILARDLAFPTR